MGVALGAGLEMEFGMRWRHTGDEQEDEQKQAEEYATPIHRPAHLLMPKI